ncbi:MAG: hypothetical protein ACLFRG_10325 [Desulfococcaceae bacterium]
MTRWFFWIILGLVIGLAAPALADDFQLVDESSGGLISYAEVSMDGRRLGYTDKYGRIRIDLPRGRYRARVRVNGDWFPFSFEISDGRGRRRMTVIRLNVGWD